MELWGVLRVTGVRVWLGVDVWTCAEPIGYRFSLTNGFNFEVA